MNPHTIFVECLNAASIKCSFKVALPYNDIAHRVAALREDAEEQLSRIIMCRLHEGFKDGCFCPNPYMLFKSTACLIAEIKSQLVSNLFDRMQMWPEFEALRQPWDEIKVIYVSRCTQCKNK